MFKSGTPPSEAVDVYGLASTLYAMLRGFPARWPSDRTPTVTTLIEMFDQPIPDLWGVPREFTALLRAAMANDPSVRPSAVQFRDRLAALSISGNGPPPPPPGWEAARGPTELAEPEDETQSDFHSSGDAPALPPKRTDPPVAARSGGSSGAADSGDRPSRTGLFGAGAALLARFGRKEAPTNTTSS
jgi:serine/threonine protein kinase